MSTILVDARGCSCPEPVLMVQKAIKQGNKLEVKVDSSNSKENILRFAEGKKLKVTVAEKDGEYVINIV